MTEHKKVTLYKGDCLEKMKLIPDGSVDLVLTDPPYGTTACKWDNVIDFELMWEQVWRVLKPNGACVLFGSEPFSSVLRVSQIKYFKYDWVWKKNAGSNFAQVRYQPMKEHELVSIFYKKPPTYIPQMQERAEAGKRMVKAGIQSKASKGGDVYGQANSKGYNTSKADPNLRFPSSVQLFNRQRGKHPTQKPVALLEYLTKTYTNENEVVLDFTMGSGSTGVACLNTDRKFIGIEMDDKYYDIAKNRIREVYNTKKEDV